MDRKRENPKSKTLEELVLDSPLNKYQLVNAVMRWAKELKQKGTVAGDSRQLLNQALMDILSGQIGVEQIQKLPIAIKMVEEKKEIKKEEPIKKEGKKKKVKK